MKGFSYIPILGLLLIRALVADEVEKKDPTNEDVVGEYNTTVVGKKEEDTSETADTVIIKREDIINSSRGTLLEAVSERSADIYVTASKPGLFGIASGASGGISIRGIGGSPNTQVLIVEDGVPDFQGIFGHPIPDAYTPDLISSVKVIKGGDSVRYGSNAMGGVLILNPLFRDDPGLSFIIDSAGGSFDTIRSRFVILGSNKTIDYSASYSYISSNGHRSFAGGRTDVATLGIRYHLTSNLKAKLLNKSVWLYGFDPGPASHPVSFHYYNVFRNNMHLKFELKKEMLKLSLTPFINIGEHKLYDGFYSIDYEGGLIVESELKFHKSINSVFGISTIGNGGYFQNRVSETKSDFADLSSYAVYNQTEIFLTPRINLQIGVRENYSPFYGDFFLYQGGVFYRFFNNLYTRLRIAKNFRHPTIRELYFPFPVANPHLKPEESINRDIELGYDDGVFSTSLTYYKSHVKNLIKYFGAWPTVESVNIDEYEVPGIEASITLKNKRGMSLYTSFNTQDVGRYTKQNPSTKLNMGFSYRGILIKNAYTVSLSMEYVSGLFEKNYSRGPMKDVFFANLGGSYDLSLFTVPLSIYFEIRNILDMEYEYIRDYPMPGINALCGMRLEI